jgi:FAD/FMN-containing dehydrogenase
LERAKLELPQKDAADYDVRLQTMRSQLAAKYPLKQFNQYRAALDPHNILSNSIIDELLSDD